MHFFERGFLSIRRRLGKNITLLILVFILANIMIGAITIKQAVKNTEVNLRNKIGAILTIEPDYNMISSVEQPDSMEYITGKEIEDIGSLPYVKYYDYTSTASLQSSTLKRYEENTSDVNGGIYQDSYNYFTLTGVQNKDMFDIKQNKIKLVTGRTFNEEEISNLKNVAMISKKLAEINGLSIGSKFTLSNIIYDYTSIDYQKEMNPSEPEVYAKKNIEFEVVGIFDPIKQTKKSTNGIDNDYQYVENLNKIYTTNKVVNAINEYTYEKYKELDPENAASYTGEYLTPLYVLKDPLDLDKFKEEVEKLIPDNYKITDNSSALDTVTVPMQNMDWIATLVLYVSMFSTIVIVGLLITLFIRDRKHEMGIYLSLGEKRKNVVLQILTEVIIVSFIGITVALFSGSLIANSVSKKMLKNEVIAEEKKNDDGGEIIYKESSSLDWLGYGSDLSSEEMIDSYKVSITPLLIIILYGVGLGTVFISTIAPTVYIIRLNPKKIMM